jgi:hypothetical protein
MVNPSKSQNNSVIVEASTQHKYNDSKFHLTIDNSKVFWQTIEKDCQNNKKKSM